MSCGLIDDRDWFELHVLFWCCPMVPSVSRKQRGPRCRVLQYVQDSLIVRCGSDRSLNTDKWVVAYGSKEDLILNATVGL